MDTNTAVAEVGIVPKHRPQWERRRLLDTLAMQGIYPKEPVFLVGVRGYYRDTMGAPGKNDRNIYDDAIFIVSDKVYKSFNANTDPSVAQEGVAVLKPGRWLYTRGLHRGRYPALRQGAPVVVVRDGAGDDTGWFGINIHKGSFYTTSSLGCQTIFPTQWEKFISRTNNEMERCCVEIIPYYLIEAQG